MTTATVRQISNGFTVNWAGSQAIGVPASLYAGTIPEVVYWLGRIFDPVSQPPAQSTRGGGERAFIGGGTAAPMIIDDTNPLLGQEAEVKDIASGGFLVTQQPNPVTAVKRVETFCANVDAVSLVLTAIYTPPVTT